MAIKFIFKLSFSCTVTFFKRPDQHVILQADGNRAGAQRKLAEMGIVNKESQAQSDNVKKKKPNELKCS